MNLFNSIYLLWVVSEIVLNRVMRSGKSDTKSADKNSLLIIWITILISITVGVFISKTLIFPIVSNAGLEFVGLSILILGIVFRLIAVKQLGRFFTVAVTIRENHELFQSGLYKYLRHPSYSGSLLSFLGFGFSLNNWFSLVLVFLPTLFAMIYRISIEEKVLEAQFGEEYIEYCSKTKRLIPFIY